MLDYRNWRLSPFTTSPTHLNRWSRSQVLALTGYCWLTGASHDARTRARNFGEIRRADLCRVRV